MQCAMKNTLQFKQISDEMSATPPEAITAKHTQCRYKYIYTIRHIIILYHMNILVYYICLYISLLLLIHHTILILIL